MKNLPVQEVILTVEVDRKASLDQYVADNQQLPDLQVHRDQAALVL